MATPTQHLLVILKGAKSTYLIAIFVLVFILLSAHAFNIQNITVDYTSILLIILLILIPLIPKITKLKYGDFEATISNKEVEKINESTKENIKNAPIKQTEKKYSKQKLTALGTRLYEVFENDHILGLAKLRLEMEKVVRDTVLEVETDKYKNYVARMSLNQMIQYLADKKKINPNIAINAKDVIAICNRAVHGETIDKVSAKEILVSGMKIIGYFYGFYEGFNDTFD
ncbi:MAG: hypothetical protein WC308_02775 [archaeon]|jgi:hypothetical protein